MYAIETRALTKAYGGRRVVDNLNLHVRTGDIYGFVGKNGAGKSTVMKMIDSLVTPDSGDILLFDSPIEALPKETGAQTSVGGSSLRSARRVGALIENPGLLPELSAFDNLMAKALAVGIPDAKPRCQEVLRLVGLEAAGKKRSQRFSQGMKQRLGIGLALLGSPDLLLLDEPFNGLDPEGTRALRTLILRLNQSFGVTVMISSHVLDQLDRMATRYGVIANGRLVREMTAEDVQAECGESLRILTSEPARTLAQLEARFPEVRFLMEPDGALRLSGTFDAPAVADALHGFDETILEFAENRCDIEDYFVNLMEGGSYVRSA